MPEIETKEKRAKSSLNAFSGLLAFRCCRQTKYNSAAPKVRSNCEGQVNSRDFSFTKDTRITERVSLAYRAEVFNLFNRMEFNRPGNQVGSSLFGVVSGQLNNPRLIQMALRLTF